jgi:hypothetical protein
MVRGLARDYTDYRGQERHFGVRTRVLQAENAIRVKGSVVNGTIVQD